jgi:hypothetical protein
MLIQFGQAGAGVGLLVAPLTPEENRQDISSASYAVLLGPVALAAVYSNKTMVRWLTVGLKEPPGTKLAARAMGQFFANLHNAVDVGITAPEDIKISVGGKIEDFRQGTATAHRRIFGKPQEAPK